MKIFIICCLLFIHVNMCIFILGFWVSIRVSDIRGFGFDDGFPPESVSGSGSGFDFGFQFWVHGDSTRSEPDPLPSLVPLPSSWPSISESCDSSFIFDEHDVVVVAAGTTKHQGSRIEDKVIRHHCLEIIGGNPCDITDHGH